MGRRAKLHSVALATWAALVGAGFFFLLKYEVTPGRAAAADASWPAGVSEMLPRDGKPVLIMAAHPECPCSRASVAELAELAARFPGKFSCYVLFEPAGSITPEGCRASALWKSAAAITGVTPLVDEKKLAVRAFHARTSGQVFLYDARGRMQFSGGITSGRDHVGPSDGTDAINAFFTSGRALPASTPVYGCALESP
ncbi:MAG TPA: RedB protein [Phycisphaerae bacterium]|nr:RedB protein [Phycisphaerae bacterium]